MIYEWSNGASAEDIAGVAAGNYSCTITNTTSGCSTVQNYLVPSVTSGVTLDSFVADDTCGMSVGNIINIISGGSGSYSYQWSNGPTSLSLTGLASGVYHFTVTDLTDGCDLHATYTVNNLETFTASGVASNASCAGCNDGSIDITVTTGAGFFNTYQYSWSNSTSTQDQAALMPGHYCVTITASTGCDTTLCYDINYDIGIQDMGNANATVSIYPNPAADFMYITLDLPETKEATLLIDFH